jgi:hypothetical protein
VTTTCCSRGARGREIDAGPASDDDPPEMALTEALDTTHIPSVAVLTGRRTAVVTTRPCRAPTSPWPMGG